MAQGRSPSYAQSKFDIDAGLANGSRGVVTSINKMGVEVKWVNGNTTIVIPHLWESDDKEASWSRLQIPLILAWSMTIHKIQGCTLDSVICNIGTSIFCAGQAYVALSRVRSLNGLFIEELYPKVIQADPDALKFVSKMEKETLSQPNQKVTTPAMANPPPAK